MEKSIFVVNCRGEKERFSLRKVYRSARKAGASEGLAQKISRIIQSEVYPGIGTLKIFQRIKELLNQESLGLGMRFSLKEGMRKLLTKSDLNLE